MKRDNKKSIENAVVRADLNMEKWPIFTPRRDQNTGKTPKNEGGYKQGDKE